MTDQAFAGRKTTISAIRGTEIVIFIDDRMNHDGLLVDRDGAIGWDRDPVVWFRLV